MKVGDGLLSHPVTRAVPSALVSLTTGFGMGPGVPSRRNHQHTLLSFLRCLCALSDQIETVTLYTIRLQNQRSRLPALPTACRSHTAQRLSEVVETKSPRPLVSVRYRHCCPSTPDLSSWWSASGLSPFFRDGESHLEVGFPLRCFQRFSAPEFATRHCVWRHNRHTSAQSTPVLSY